MAVGARWAASADKAVGRFSVPYAAPFAGGLTDGVCRTDAPVATVGYAAQGTKVAAVRNKVVVGRARAALPVARPAAVLCSAAFVDPAAVVDISVAVACEDGDTEQLVGARVLDVWHRPGCQVVA